MKITFVVTKLNYTGGEYYDIVRQARALVEIGHELTILTIFPRLNNIIEELPFKVIEEPAPSNRLLPLQFYIYKLLKKYSGQTDIFYLFATAFLFGGGWYRFRVKSGKPVATYINSYADYVEGFYRNEPLYPRANLAGGQSWFRKIKHKTRIILERYFGVYLINHLDAIIMMSKTVAEYYIRIGVKKEKITIIPSFHDIISLQKMPIGKNPFINYPSETFHILFFGRFHIEKSADLLIKAFSQCNFSNAILHLVGDGPEKENLKKLVTELNLGDKVVFHPWQKPEDLLSFLQHAQLFVYPARLPEAKARVTTEAMALGLPLVLPDTSAENWAALGVAKVFKNGDCDDLKIKLDEAYRDKEFQNQARINGKKLAQKYDYRNFTLELEKVLLSAIKN